MSSEGLKNVRLYDIAEKLGISVNTVSKAIRGKGGVSESRRQQILAEAEKMGYVPNRLATSLRYGRSKMIAVIFDNLINPYFMIMTKMLIAKLRKLDYDILVMTEIYDSIKMSDLGNILSRKVDGIITFIEPSEQVMEFLKREGIGLVLLGRKNSKLEVDSVTTDDFHGGYLVGNYLIERGAKKIGYLGSPKQVECAQRRLNGLLKSLEENGVAYDESDFQFMDCPDMEKQATRLIENGVDAVFCFNDIMALDFYSRVHAHGLRVPKDIRIVGYDDVRREFPLAVSLTSVAFDKVSIVESVIELLFSRISGQEKTGGFIQREFEVFISPGETA